MRLREIYKFLHMSRPRTDSGLESRYEWCASPSGGASAPSTVMRRPDMSTASADSVDRPDLQWRDRKRHLWLLGLVPPTALFVATALVWGGNELGLQSVTPVLWWIGPLLIYVLVPLLDLFVGPDGENPPEELFEQLENGRFYRYCTYLYLPFQFASLVFACYLWSAEDLSWLGIDGGL